ncbi:hypothetical protein DAPPUDRAFT_105648 [Daphnia pulex]|uniref:Uncharacterized protein n=1 Tax=Daphnia pulex TaxID=6669 RepID=E9GRD2_DAPPU|nr:hypothetical protein DAPPUDRAFT_105648 [Daphnia pulex]|eukprot:EFX78016.1 hypothetical protein DAPPUDRAFT_105648 [Daphnia pulex]
MARSHLNQSLSSTSSVNKPIEIRVDYPKTSVTLACDKFASKLSREGTKVSNMRSNRYGTAYSNQQHVDKPAAISEYSYDVKLSYNQDEVDPYYPEESPADFKPTFVFDISPDCGRHDHDIDYILDVDIDIDQHFYDIDDIDYLDDIDNLDDINDIDDDDAIDNIDINNNHDNDANATSTATTGTYKTIRNPGNQVEQCVSITVVAGSRVQMICTSVYTAGGTYVTILDQSGTSIIANPPTVNVAYTSVDNTLLIKSLASSANSDTLCCTWTTV